MNLPPIDDEAHPQRNHREITEKIKPSMLQLGERENSRESTGVDQCYILSSCSYAKQHYTGEDVMSSEMSFSILVWSRPDLENETTQLRVVRVDTGQALNFSESSFLLRIWLEENGTALRCLIRHIASGREAYIQSGPNLQDFVKACLLPDSNPDPATPGSGALFLKYEEKEKMPKTVVLGNGPVAFTDQDGRMLLIPLSALTLDGNTIEASA